MKSIHALVIAVTLSLGLAPVAFSQTTKSETAINAAVSQGEVKKVDAEAGKLTIKHGELKNINMGAMTMVFDVADKAMLSQLKVGDAITFTAANAGGQLSATNIKVKK